MEVLMSKTVRVVVAVLGVLGVAAATRKAGMWGDNSSGAGVSGVLPLSCRLRGHTWKSSGRLGQAPTRRTCAKCQRIDLPMP